MRKVKQNKKRESLEARDDFSGEEVLELSFKQGGAIHVKFWGRGGSRQKSQHTQRPQAGMELTCSRDRTKVSVRAA